MGYEMDGQGSVPGRRKKFFSGLVVSQHYGPPRSVQGQLYLYLYSVIKSYSNRWLIFVVRVWLHFSQITVLVLPPTLMFIPLSRTAGANVMQQDWTIPPAHCSHIQSFLRSTGANVTQKDYTLGRVSLEVAGCACWFYHCLSVGHDGSV